LLGLEAKQKMSSNEITENQIPDYDEIFLENRNKKDKNNALLKKILRVNFWSLVQSSFMYLFQVLPVFAVPVVSSNIINLVTEAVSTGMNNDILFKIIINAVVMFSTIIINVPATVIRFKFTSKALRSTSAGIRCSVVRKLQSLSITYFKNMENGKIQSKYLKDVDSIDAFLNNIYHVFSVSIINLFISVVISIITNGYVALFFLLIVPVNILLTRFFRNKVAKGYKKFRIENENMSIKLNTMLDMMFVTKSHGLEKLELSNVKQSISHVATSGLAVDKINSIFGSTAWAVNMLIKGINLIFCVFLAIKGIIKVGDIILFQTMFAEISGNIQTIIASLPILGSGSDAVDSVSEIMNIKDVENNLGKRDVERIKGNLKFDHITYCYPTDDIKVIDDLSLEVKQGECIAVVGSSGSGKTTLMNMIIGFLHPSKGSVYVDGMDMKDLNLEEYRHNISVVPQSSILFSGSIKDNITYGLDHYTEEELNKVVEMANLNEVIEKFDNGIDTNIGEHGDKLSGGQKQRITIARALIRNPKILIFDEATSALDNISEFHVQKAIQSSVKGRTTFIVAHRLSTIRNADKIIVMEQGKIVEYGSYDELMNLKGKFFELKNLNDMKTKQATESLESGK